MGWNLGANYRMSDTMNDRSLRKRRKLAGKLANVCPHLSDLEPVQVDGEFALQVHYLFETFVGTLSYFCQGCGTEWTEHTMAVYERQLRARFEADPKKFGDEIYRQIREANEIKQKLNLLGGLPGR